MKKLYLVVPALLLLCCSTLTQAQSPPNLNTDILWTDTGGVFDIANGIFDATFNGPADIEAAFNNARAQEEVQLGLTAGSIPDLVLPAGWTSLSDNEKALFLLNDEREARAGIDYPSDAYGAVLGLPLEGIELHLDQMAQSHAEWLLDNDAFSHTGACAISSFDRIDNHPVLGEDVSGSQDCHEFMNRSENLKAFYTSGSSISLPIERSFYCWIYEDAVGSWGHREACLLQDNTVGGNPYGFTNNTGDASSEGFLGIARIGGDYGPLNYGEVIVMKIIDPDPNASCAATYAIEGNTLPTGLIPTAVPVTANIYEADRSFFEEATGFTHYIDDNETPGNFADDLLLLSIDKKNNFIGDIGDCDMTVELIMDADDSPLVLMPADAPYVSNPMGWYIMQRYWDVTPTTQPSEDIEVRQYFTNTEFTNLQSAINGAGGSLSGMSQLNFYKVTDVEPNDHENIALANYHQLSNGSSSLDNWQLGAYHSDFSAQYHISSFSGGGGGAGGGAGGALPISLYYFEAQAKEEVVYLEWASLSEVDNDYYTLSRSSDGRRFEEVAQINGNGTTSELQQYSYKDHLDKSGTYYYRLSQTDFDGQLSYVGDIQEVTLRPTMADVSIFPNPVLDQININISDYKSSYSHFEIYDVLGRK